MNTESPMVVETTSPRAEFIGPILGWELIGLARRARYFMVRAGYALLLLATMWIAYQVAFGWNFGAPATLQQSASFAEAFFQSFVWAQTFVALALTPAFVATGIPREREQKTIEYLFVSDLTNREIVLGKLLARVINLFMVILVGVPIAAMAGLFGGVDYLGLLIATVGTALVMLTVASCSMVVSLYCSTTRRALTASYGLLFFVSVGVPGLLMLGSSALESALVEFAPAWGDAFKNLFREEWFQKSLIAISLAHPLAPLVLATFGRFGVGTPWTFSQLLFLLVVIHLAISGVMILWAIYVLRSSHREQASAGVAPTWRESLQQKWRRRRPTVYSDWPLLWKELHAGGGRARSWSARVGMTLCVLLFFGSFFHLVMESLQGVNLAESLRFWLASMSVVVVGIGYVTVVFRSASSIGEEKDRDCWTSLLAAPVSAGEIILSKIFGAMRALTPFLLLLGVPVIVAVGVQGMTLLGVLYWLAGILTFGFALAALGVYQSLRQSNSARAIALTMVPASLVGGILHIFILPILALSGESVDLWLGSLPWAPLAMAPFVGEVASQTFMDTMKVTLVFMVLYVVFGVVVTLISIRMFPRSTGRIEGTVMAKSS